MNSPTEMPATLNDLVTKSAASDAAVCEIRVNVEEVKFGADGIVYAGQMIPMDQATRTRLFAQVGAPVWYWQKHSPRFQAAALAEHAARLDFSYTPTLVLRDGGLVTIVRGNLFTLPDGAVLRAVQEALGTEGEDLMVARIARTEERLDVEVVSPSKGIAVRPGDVVQAGLHIVHERFGNQRTLIEAFVHRLVCSNGMTRRECVGNVKPRARKLPASYPAARAVQMNQIRRLTQQTWGGLQAQLEALRATSERPADVEALLRRYLHGARISERTMMRRLRVAWRAEGAENTHYGAVNALTRVATHDRDLSERQRRVLASLAGLLAFAKVHICEKCFSVLTRSAADNRYAA